MSTSNTVTKEDLKNILNEVLPIGGSGLEVYTVEVTGVSISANNVVETTASATKTGYTPLALVGFMQSGSGVSYVFPYHLYLSGETIYYAFRNDSTSARSGLTYTFYVLYKKN